MTDKAYFSKELFNFLKELRENNNRDWFLANKDQYEAKVKSPFLQFIADFSTELDKISSYYVADPRPNGGSLFRINRDVRFSLDKSPYKRHVAAYFPHRAAKKDISSPGFYLHLEPSGCFGGAGLWHPDAATLKRVRTTIIEQPQTWQEVLQHNLRIEGERLTRPPKGFPAEHQFIEYIKFKDYVCSVKFTQTQVCGPNFLQDFTKACKEMAPLVKFLTEAVGLDW